LAVAHILHGLLQSHRYNSIQNNLAEIHLLI